MTNQSSVQPKHADETWRKIKGAEALQASHGGQVSANPDTAIIPRIVGYVEIDNTGFIIRRVPWPHP